MNNVKPTSIDQAISRSSLHPYYYRCYYKDKVHIKDADGLWIVFRNKCKINKEDAALTFYEVYIYIYLLFIYLYRIVNIKK